MSILKLRFSIDKAQQLHSKLFPGSFFRYYLKQGLCLRLERVKILVSFQNLSAILGSGGKDVSVCCAYEVTFIRFDSCTC